jgi:hypothetical protein
VGIDYKTQDFFLLCITLNVFVPTVVILLKPLVRELLFSASYRDKPAEQSAGFFLPTPPQ